MNSIAEHVSACLQEFHDLCSSPTIWGDSFRDEGPQSDISLLKLQNELSRFKVWSGNIGAHRKGRSSLDHRLRDASNIRDQVIELLKDLKESLQDANNILTGYTTPWDQDLSPAQFSDDDSDDEPFQVDTSGPSELSQIFAAIVEDINCLFRLSASIHNPSPHDRFKKACLTDTSGYEPFDVQHVCNKLSKAPKPIAERLGKAISRRRQYFKYRELHHDKLASGFENDDNDQMQSTVASSLPKKLNLNEPISLEEDVDEVSDTGRSQTSWATSAANPERRKIPALPAEAENGSFECPFCFMMISISSRNLWKKHVFSDLFPYICVELGCPAPDQDFQRRHQWAGHVKKYHWKTWTCSLGCNKTFGSSQDMKRHLAQRHSETAELTHLDSLLTMCERPKSENEPTDCPLCNEKQSSFKQYQRHVGRHQEDLALFALPQLPGEEEGGGNEEDESEGKSQEAEQEGAEAQKQPLAQRRNSLLSLDRPDRWPGQEKFEPAQTNQPDSQQEFAAAVESKRNNTSRDRKYMCMQCPYTTNRKFNLMRHMKCHELRAPGRADTQDRTKDKKLPPTSAIEFRQPSTPWDNNSANEASESTIAAWMQNTVSTDDVVIDPVQTPSSLDPTECDVLRLNHNKLSQNFFFTRHAIRDGKLRVSRIRDLAVGMTNAPESLRHMVELFFKETKLEIDSTPIRNYGISTGDVLKVESPQFRKPGQLSGSASKNPWMGNKQTTEGNMELEGKAERDKRRAEFSRELRQRAMMESSSDQVPVPETLSDLETRDTRQAIAASQPSIEIDENNLRALKPGVRCPTCALEGKEIWVVPGRCCGYCGTPCVDEDVPDTHYSLGRAISNGPIIRVRSRVASDMRRGH
ncbi:uncharacterized protein BKA55DRAFT_535862 [Fusarium redolens]|uniref:C2H2-type domain-containing protein n=1 Tax=Fusarium redolens TaxID=48865 RepID=A0A9P9KGM4_FUSRE|nr:uncharacterized protein BKA55DRAFT_535862 [Fusarium redolens]KAH7260848.1 hypothetical protein BKA55DRAFT_535862 [Fusarium redolens]